ncbi:MAG: hypothetical protein ABR987_15290 [Terracidiphilus sp.]|jgi:hypothetical protein
MSFSSLDRPLHFAVAASLIWIPFAVGSFAQEPAQSAAPEADRSVVAAPVVPQQVRYAGKFATRTGETVEADFRIYAAAEGGDPLWTETQRVTVSEEGSYSVLLGSASPAGLPQTVFAGGAARWLGVSVERAAEQERVLLSSVPYAMKSADAESLAGHAASDFVTQEQLAQLTQSSVPSGQKGAAAPDVQPEDSPESVTGLGTTGTVPLWTGQYLLGNSSITQSGTSIGINEATPATTLDVGGTSTFRGMLTLPPRATATTASGQGSQEIDLEASTWSTTATAPVNQNFKIFAWRTGNNTATPSGALYFQYQEGSGAVANILTINSNGTINFAPTQAFPGTIKSVSATSPVTAATTSGAVSLGLNTSALETTLNSVYPRLNSANVFTGNQSIAGNMTATGALTAASSTISGETTATGGVLTEGEVRMQPATAATAAAGVNSPPLEIDASAYNSTSSSSVLQKFAWETLAADNDTSTPMGNLALLFAPGSGTLESTGLSIAQNGNITFASGQTFPGTGAGTIAGITTSSPLTGSGTSGSVALGLNTSELESTLNKVYSSLNGSNSFLGTETFTGFSTGILSTANSAGGTAIYAAAGASGGTGVSSTGAAYGVIGSSTGAGGIGVEGAGNYGVEAFGQAYGVYATATSSGSSGLWGQGAQYGVYGTGGQFGLYGNTNSGPGTAGVYGVGSVGVQGGGITYGVQGGTTSSSGIGVFGSSSGSNGVGVQGSGTVGVQGNGAVGVQGSTSTAGAPAFTAWVRGRADTACTASAPSLASMA